MKNKSSFLKCFFATAMACAFACVGFVFANVEQSFDITATNITFDAYGVCGTIKGNTSGVLNGEHYYNLSSTKTSLSGTIDGTTDGDALNFGNGRSLYGWNLGTLEFNSTPITISFTLSNTISNAMGATISGLSELVACPNFTVTHTITNSTGYNVSSQPVSNSNIFFKVETNTTVSITITQVNPSAPISDLSLPFDLRSFDDCFKLVTLNANTGTGLDKVQSIRLGEKLSSISNPFTKAGYTFAGWSFTSNGSVNPTDITTSTTTTLYAQWTANTYSVTLDNQSPTTEGTTSVTATYDSAMPTITTPTKTFYTFGGYFTEENGGGTQYYNADGTSTINWNIAENTTLYAQWTPNTYSITLDNQSPTTAGTTSVTATYGSAMPAITVPTKTFYTFGGYFTETNGAGTQYYNSDGSSTVNWNIAENTTLYAKWEYAVYSITYKDQGDIDFTGTHGSNYPTTHTYGTATTLVNPTKSNYFFQGWFTSSDCSGTAVTTLGATDYESDITLYAKWLDGLVFTFTLDDTNHTATVSGYTGSGGAVTIPSTISKGSVVETQKNWTRDSLEYAMNEYELSYPLVLFVDGVENTYDSYYELEYDMYESLYDATSITQTVYIQQYQDGNAYTVTSIGQTAFQNCTSITSVTIPAGVTSIGDSAFNGCSSLTTITIPNRVTSIGSSAFSGCTGLTSVSIPSSVISIESTAFSACSNLTSIIVDNANTVYDSRNNCNAVIESSTNTLVLGCKNTTIPNTVTSLGSSAFQNCSGLTSITIPSSVTSIGQDAFADCSGLTSITIPSSVTSIGNMAFRCCSGLTSVTIERTGSITIGYQTFGDSSTSSLGKLACNSVTLYSLNSTSYDTTVTHTGINGTYT